MKKHTRTVRDGAAVIYARYSSAAQNDESIEQQVEACQRYAERRGLAVGEIYADRAVSGRSDRRPEFQRLMRDAADGCFSTVLAWKSSRMGRNMLEAMMNDARLTDCGVRCLYVEEDFDDTAAGRFALRNMMNVNQFYSENLTEDVRRGMEDNARRCRVNGRVMFGYRKNAEGLYEADPVEAPALREIFERVAAGETLADIGRDLTARGILTKNGKPWGKHSFHGLLTNERYTGVYIYDTIRIEGGMPALVDRELFGTVQERVRRMNRLAQGRRRGDRPEYLLTGRLYCGECGSLMTGSSGVGKGGDMYCYYRCRNQAIHHTCAKKPVRRDRIEPLVAEVVRRFVLQDDAIEWLADRFMRWRSRLEGESDVAALRRRLDEVSQALGNLLRAIEAGVLTPTTKDRMAELEGEKSALLARIRDAQRRIPAFTREHVVCWLQSFRDGSVTDPRYTKRLIQQFLRAVYLYDNRAELVFDLGNTTTPVEVPDLRKADNNVIAFEDWVYHYVDIRTPLLAESGGVFFLLFEYEIV